MGTWLSGKVAYIALTLYNGHMATISKHQDSPRQRFLDYVRHQPGARPVVSPFLPKPGLITSTLRYLGLSSSEDPIEDELALSRALDYEPMFYAPCTQFIFPWREDGHSADPNTRTWVLPTTQGEWVREIPRGREAYGDENNYPVKTVQDHTKLVATCEQVVERETEIWSYFNAWRERIGENGVIIIGHPHIPWLGDQIGPQTMIFHAADYPVVFERSMDAIFQAACIIFTIAMEQGIDFMSEASYGLEMISPQQFEAQDVRYIARLARFTHNHGGLFWYHNCGKTRALIHSGAFNRLGADVIETIAPPPEGDNDLAESRRALDPSICTKGNLSLGLLRDGTPEDVIQATRAIIGAVKGATHIISTADAVYAETPPENFVAFLQTAREIAVNT
jgi:hypothetical protein